MQATPRSRAGKPPASALRRGLAYGFIGVVAFSVTLPATRIAVASLDPVLVGLGRAVIAAIVAAVVLFATRSPFPRRALLPRLAIVAFGVIVGFPMLTAWAMQHVPASHGAIFVGLLPLATAAAGAWLAHERPSRWFWSWAVAGSGAVVAFAIYKGDGAVHGADLLLVAAVLAAAVGYAEGARLSRELGGWQVISWALVLCAPALAIPTAFALGDVRDVPLQAWLAFAYVSIVSMYLGFFAWYKGLALGGIAAVGQVQLLQPFLTLLFSALLLGESLDVPTFIAAGVVIASIALGRRR